MSLRVIAVCIGLALFGSCATTPADRPTPPGDKVIPGEVEPHDPRKEPDPRPQPGDKREPSQAMPPVPAPALRDPLPMARTARAGRAPKDHAEPATYEAFQTPLSRFVNAAKGLNMRAAPGTSAAVVAVLDHRAPVTVLGRHLALRVIASKEGHWLFVEAGGRRGWVFEAFLVAERPDSPDLQIADLFAATAIRARLVVSEPEGERFLGGFVKKAETVEFRVETLTRLCGRGETDKSVTFSADGLSFAIGYRWCSVDPSDIVHTQCVQCKLLRYQCTVSGADLRSGRNEAGSYQTPITCVPDGSAFCEKDCDKLSPLRDVE